MPHVRTRQRKNTQLNSPALSVLLSLYAPDEPIGPVEGMWKMVQRRGQGWVIGQRTDWPKKAYDLRKKFPGYQPGHNYRENMKYGRYPAEGAPQDDWVTAFINHSKAIWSRDLETGVHHQQFDAWFATYIKDVKSWDSSPQMLEAVEFLRHTCKEILESQEA